jgi:hypothetical protein
MKQMSNESAVVLAGLAVLAVLLGAAPVGAEQTSGDGWIWWEAESPSETNWPDGKGVFAPRTDDQKARVSGGVWLTSYKAKDAYFLQYEIDVPADGDYTLWSRNFANPRGGTRTPYRWRFDGGDWVSQPKGSGEAVNAVKPIPKTTLSWIRLATVKLDAGKHTFRVEVTDPAEAAGFDCFVLAKVPFVPNGTLKPGEKLGLAEPGTWAFEPDRDPYKDTALVDLRFLNEKVAGQSGYVRRSPEGDGFVLGDGSPVRFWSVEYHPGPGMEDAREQARFFAKRGVNAVRFFRSMEDSSRDGTGHEINEHMRDALWRTVAAMREQGIYTMITPFWLFNDTMVYPDWGWKNWQTRNRGKFRRPNGAIFIDPDYQEAYRQWMRKIMLPPNPYTGIPLAKDPSIYCVQFQNEHGILWSWVWGSPPEVARKLGRDFGDWAKARYGSLDKALAAWGGEKVTANDPGKGVVGDDFANGIAGLPPHYAKLKEYWAKSKNATPGLNKRYSDFLEFFAGYMRDWHRGMAAFYREELGYKGLISANNWKGQGANLTDVERYTYTVNDIDDHHNYFAYPVANPTEPRAAGYQVNDGDLYVDKSALFEPIAICTGNKYTDGMPTMVSEGTWLGPLSYRAECPLLMAAYGSLTGLDMFDFFAWSGKVVNWDPSVTKFGMGSPDFVGQFPANALIYRRGYVREASEPAVLEVRALQDMWDREAPLIEDATLRDPNRAEEDSGRRNETFVDGLDIQLAYVVGPVRVRFGGDPAETKVVDLKKYVDTDAKTIDTLTGEMQIDYGRALFRLNTPKAQAVCGYLSKVGQFRLDDVTVNSKDHYAAVVVASMDAQPLQTSKRVLVQVGTRNRPYGWKDKEGVMVKGRKAKFGDPELGKQIVSMGRMPWNVVEAELTVEVRNPGLTRATVCDPNGYPVKELTFQKTNAGISFRFPRDALYVVLR